MARIIGQTGSAGEVLRLDSFCMHFNESEGCDIFMILTKTIDIKNEKMCVCTLC